MNSLLLVGLEVRRGKTGIREKSQVRDNKVVGIQTQKLEVSLLLCHSLIFTAALGSQREINSQGTSGQEPCFLSIALSSAPSTERSSVNG